MVPVSHAYLGATASDTGSVGESDRRWQDGKIQLTVQILDDTPPVLSLGQLCEDHGYSYELA